MFHLFCVHPFHGYAKGQKVTEPSEVARLMNDRDHHFVRVPAPTAPPASDEPVE
jgi:hypothetical protein